MQDLLGQVVGAHCGQLPDTEQLRLATALDRCVWPLVTTPRLGKQLLRKADFALPVVRGEANPLDQVILQALELLHPDLHRFIATNRSLLVDRPAFTASREARCANTQSTGTATAAARPASSRPLRPLPQPVTEAVQLDQLDVQRRD